MKIAILMLVHNNLLQTKKLIEHLSKDFDIYVHIDKKSDIKEKDIQGTNIFAFKKYRVYWGSYSQIQTVLYLLKKAFKNGYDRYLLISGSDLPLKSNQQIIDFFNTHREEFIDHHKLPWDEWNKQAGGFKRIQYYHNTYKEIYKNFFDKMIYYYTNRLFSKFNKIFKVSRKIDHVFYGGINWFNLSHKCVQQIMEYLSANKSYLRRFKFTLCADEIFFQTIICNYTKDIEIVNNSLRYIKWGDSEKSPNILTQKYLSDMLNSDHLFARKFDENVDNEVIEKLYDRIK